MPVDNHPFANPPRLPSPTKGRVHEHRRQHSRNLSRSPVRQHARDCDPLLRNLSPTSTLRAFVTDPSTMTSSDALYTSIQHSSVSERALGAKAAQTCLDLRTWTREMESWDWPGTFDVPEPARKKMRMSTLTFESVLSQNTIATTGGEEEDAEVEHEFWGSLPARTVELYEKRADEIGQQLDRIDVEEFKEYVLVSHYRADSRASSRMGVVGEDSSNTTPEMKRLDDFTALVTATILQALPYIPRLNRLLDVWTIRLMVLRSAPRFLRDLKRARTDLDHGWASIAVSSVPGSGRDHAQFDRQTMLQMKAMIEQQVGSLGRRLDRCLDDLEGREDTVPDIWIDEFESLEAAYGSWVVQAERKILENEWRARRASVEPSAAPGPSRRQQEHSAAISETEDPILDHDAVMRASMDVAKYNRDPEADRGPQSTNRSAGGQSQTSNNHLRNLESLAIPALLPSGSENGSERADSVTAAATISREGTPTSDSASKEDGISQIAKRRAAFLNGIEKTNSLNQSKSPVRPFEHASNAFTRLFKKDRSPEQKIIRRTASGRVSSTESTDKDTSRRKSPTPESEVDASNDNKDGKYQSSGLPIDDNGSGARENLDLESTQVIGNARGANTTGIHHEHRNLSQEAIQRADFAPEARPPTKLSSPFHSPDEERQPDNWPLRSHSLAPVIGMSSAPTALPQSPSSNGGSDSGPEIKAPRSPLEVDAFDRMFVQSLPSTPKSRPRSSRAARSTAPWTGPQKRAASLPRASHRVPDMPKPEIPASFPCMPFDGASRVSSSFSRPRLAGQKGKSRAASIHDVGVGVPTLPHEMTKLPRNGPERLSAPASRPKATNSATTHHVRSGSSPPATPTSPELDFDESEIPSTEAEAEEERPHIINRASTTSIETFPRSRLRSIDLHKPKHGIVSPRPTPPQTPKVSSDAAASENFNPMEFKGMLAFPTPPLRRSSLATPVSGNETPTVLRGPSDVSPLVNGVGDSPLDSLTQPAVGALNAAMVKRRGKTTLKIEDEHSLKMGTEVSAKLPRANRAEDDIDRLDRHVSDVLSTLPPGIRFKPRPGAETPALSTDGRASIGPRTKQSASRKNASMTIAPAETSPKKTHTSSDEVRLYHLTQIGREEQPIKLFVRLVGENERVMVRVGGGWADLADFLRQYAEHHGSRTASEGAVEVLTMSQAHARKASGPVEFRAKTPSTPTEAVHRPSSKDSDEEWARSGPVGRRPKDGRNSPISGRDSPTSAHTSTPKSSSTGSRPGTANVSRPSSRQGTGEVGLAGPSSGKKAGLPEHKAKWVEGMIERAKKASAEKSKEDREKYFGELGKAGGTRRVVFRSSSSTGPDGKAK